MNSVVKGRGLKVVVVLGLVLERQYPNLISYRKWAGISGCLQLLEILEILEISWNLKFLL